VLSLAIADGGDDSVEIGVGHGRPRRKTQAPIKQVFSHFSADHPGGIMLNVEFFPALFFSGKLQVTSFKLFFRLWLLACGFQLISL